MVRRNYTEDDVAEAILDTTGRGLSQNEAAQKRGVPQSTLSGRLSGQASRNERIQAHQRIPKSQGETLIRWVLRQESLGYALSHSQVRACVEAILQQQGDNKPLGKYWTTRFVKRHLELSTKLGKRQEAARFDGFTPKAVNWYFDIRENEYGWIKPENTVNVDEGGIMVGFGLDSLVIGSSDPKKKAMLKGVQSRTWTSFIEAVTATGRALKPGIIFKGKELQKQWFLNEFELIADWHYITSPNGWTDNHIALEWLKDVYLPQTEPRDASDARLIILDGHGSHAQDEWMATCFLNNVYCCYLPAHCSHGLQPLDNGIFNVIKGAYRKELQKLASLTDSAPDDKVHFIRAYAKAREAGMRKDIILSGWRFTGNWPINRHKALTHPEIQPDKEKVPERFKTPSPPQLHSDDTPKTSRQVRDLAKHRSRPTRRKYSKMAKGLEALEMKVAVQNARITGLEEQMAQVRRGKKRKAVPDPNRRFMALAETLTAGEALPDSKKAEIEVDVDEKVESVIEVVLDGNTKLEKVGIWGEQTDAWEYPTSLTQPISDFLNTDVRLVYKGPTPRILRGCGSPKLLGRTEATKFADMMPILVGSLASIGELNERLIQAGENEIGIERFRPNIIIRGGGEPWTEDSWKALRINEGEGSLDLDVVSRCLRCQVPNVDPETADKHPRQPWNQLVKYRRIDPGLKFKPSFGMLCVPRTEGLVTVGMKFNVTATTNDHFFINPMK
ncbi:hypothetical protein HZS61_011283 [Fusarium oxysporum f. sp. conglutinans]|uniref:HTH CENPB-type domain-containing protein n=2 Tax=Fusarium oxysporum f. sp. conglutinans TaxID=100902 RepID=A0A8H6GW67_FUSOX|nr:hypothetical protein HZS61_011283 [Fusarium oxysporum f. sp. conglutinans]